jgi:hypothetical protein
VTADASSQLFAKKLETVLLKNIVIASALLFAFAAHAVPALADTYTCYACVLNTKTGQMICKPQPCTPSSPQPV